LIIVGPKTVSDTVPEVSSDTEGYHGLGLSTVYTSQELKACIHFACGHHV